MGAQRDEYDQIIGYELLDYDSKEDILMLGLQYNFKRIFILAYKPTK